MSGITVAREWPTTPGAIREAITRCENEIAAHMRTVAALERRRLSAAGIVALKLESLRLERTMLLEDLQKLQRAAAP